jgi:hypothetical protein
MLRRKSIVAQTKNDCFCIMSSAALSKTKFGHLGDLIAKILQFGRLVSLRELGEHEIRIENLF